LQVLGDGVAVEPEVLVGGDPASAILDAARADTDLLVLGSRAYGPMRRALLGSVLGAVVRHASCPVLVTPRIGESVG
jgi:nucleotide-binding universal stress UspA family protein